MNLLEPKFKLGQKVFVPSIGRSGKFFVAVYWITQIRLCGEVGDPEPKFAFGTTHDPKLPTVCQEIDPDVAFGSLNELEGFLLDCVHAVAAKHQP